MSAARSKDTFSNRVVLPAVLIIYLFLGVVDGARMMLKLVKNC